jgi:hypothetical protein
MNDITSYQEGDRIQITYDSLRIIKNGNLSVLNSPSDYFVRLVSNNVGVPGTVIRRHRPGYEITVKLDNGQAFHMKDNWVERL